MRDTSFKTIQLTAVAITTIGTNTNVAKTKPLNSRPNNEIWSLLKNTKTIKNTAIGVYSNRFFNSEFSFFCNILGSQFNKNCTNSYQHNKRYSSWSYSFFQKEPTNYRSKHDRRFT